MSGAGAHRHWRLLVDRVNADPICGAAELRLSAEPGGPNLCVGGTPGASNSHASFPPPGAFDGNPDTYWSANWNAQSAGWWLAYDFGPGAAHEVREVAWRARHDYAGGCPADARLQWSDDGAAWTDAARFTDPSPWSAGQAKAWAVPSRAAGGHRRWTLHCLDLNSSPLAGIGVCVGELAFRASPGGAAMAPAEATASSSWRGQAGNGPAMAFDGTPTTLWAAATAGDGVGSSWFNDKAWIAADFGAGQTRDVAEVALTSRNDGSGNPRQTPKRFWVGFSDDGVRWGVAALRDAASWTAAGQTQAFAVPAAPNGDGGGAAKRRFLLVS